jgi:inositol-hexakisphosphate/diphosphoinositol-pentakisphosphate 1-kinase
MQHILMDRRLVLTILDTIGVPTPKRLVRQTGGSPTLSNDVRAEMIKFVKKNIEFDTRPMEITQPDIDTVRVIDWSLEIYFITNSESRFMGRLYVVLGWK